MSATTNMVLIETKTVGAGGAASIEFTGIPQTGYTDLQVVWSGRSNVAAVSSVVLLSFNSTTTGFTNRFLYGNGSSVVSSTSLDRHAGGANGSTSTASTFSSTSIYIPNYTGSTYKSWSVDNAMENNGTEGYDLINAGLWSNTAAITSLSLTVSGGSFVEGSTASLYGIKSTSNLVTAKATGGIIYKSGSYIYHAFTSSGTFTPTAGTLSCDVLMVAGGGAGYAYSYTGGGGAGGVVYTSATSVSSALTIAVGAGGNYTYQNPFELTSGGNTTVTGLTTAIGGGYGSTTTAGITAASGGSGGGGSSESGYTSGAAGTSGQGYAGGNGIRTGSPAYAGGGGGGAGGAGSAGVDQGSYSSTGGAGGVGTSAYSAFGLATGTGEVVGGVAYFAGGGGGNGSNAVGAGGYGGGGNGTRGVGLPGTGGGGSAAGGNGGSGIVIVRYAA